MFVNLYGNLLVKLPKRRCIWGDRPVELHLPQSFGIQRNDVALFQVKQIASRNTQIGPLRAHRHLHVIVSWIPVHLLGPMLFYILIVSVCAAVCWARLQERVQPPHRQQHLDLVHAIADIGIDGDVIKIFIISRHGNVQRILFMAQQSHAQRFLKFPILGPLTQRELGHLIDHGRFHLTNHAIGVNSKAFPPSIRSAMVSPRCLEISMAPMASSG